jgi:glycosyltransferase involved in cell wall biosynthesis
VAVILFLHLKDRMLWPLVHWLKWRRIPVAFWTKTRNLDEPDSPLRNFLFDYMLWLHDGLILYSDGLLKNVPARQKHKAFPANNTINFEDFPEVKESKAEIKRQLGIPFKKTVLFAGRMDVDGGRKRVDHLIEIFRDVQGRDAGLVIVGSGMKDEWRARMNPKTTICLGEVHDPQNRQISRVFKMADVCAIPGHVGLSLNQAFYFGLPVVTEEGKHPPEIGYLKPGRNGFIVPENDLAQLREKLFTLLDQDALREEFSQNAREDILQNASVEGMYRGFRDCVRFLDGAKRKVGGPDGTLANMPPERREIT